MDLLLPDEGEDSVCVCFILLVILRASLVSGLDSDINLRGILSFYCFKYRLCSFLSSLNILIMCSPSVVATHSGIYFCLFSN